MPPFRSLRGGALLALAAHGLVAPRPLHRRRAATRRYIIEDGQKVDAFDDAIILTAPPPPEAVVIGEEPPPEEPSGDHLAVAALLAVAVLWGTNFPAVRYLVADPVARRSAGASTGGQLWHSCLDARRAGASSFRFEQ